VGQRHDSDDDVLRLLVGLMLLGGKEAARRARAASTAALDSSLPGIASPPGLRSALIGGLFLGAHAARMAAHDAVELASRVLSHRLPRLKAKLDELTDLGRAEEERSMHVASIVVREATQEVIRAVAGSDEIREVVLERGSSLTEATADELRSRAEAADDRVDRLLGSLFHRHPSGGEGER
jgi:hypothetical protein